MVFWTNQGNGWNANVGHVLDPAILDFRRSDTLSRFGFYWRLNVGSSATLVNRFRAGYPFAWGDGVVLSVCPGVRPLQG